ncbi:MAG: hypothetical protein V4505_13970 [Pseudomonadota bacterium]
MPINIFSPIVRGDHGMGVSWTRRVGHSASNYFTSIDRSSFSLGGTPAQVLNVAGNVGGTLGGVAGVATIAGAAVASGAFLAACAGPQVAVTAAVVGLALLVKGTYSNRESAHHKLKDYVWNLVDDQAPTKLFVSVEELDSAADAAMTLLDDGKSQIKLLGSKLGAAQLKFADFNTKIVAVVNEFTTAKQNYGLVAPGPNRNMYLGVHQTTMDRAKAKAEAMWAKESVQGGAIFEYVRRCSHTGNYLQAPHVVALAMKEKHSPGSVVGKVQTDYFAGSSIATNSRDAFTLLDTEYKKRLP